MAILPDPNDATTIVEFEVLEEVCFDFTAQLKDGGSDIAKADLSAITLTLFLTRDGTTSPAGTIVNGRDDQDIDDDNDVTISATGLLTWKVQPEDTTIINDEIEICEQVQINCREVHRAIFAWTLTNGREGKKVVDFIVRNLETVP